MKIELDELVINSGMANFDKTEILDALVYAKRLMEQDINLTSLGKFILGKQIMDFYSVFSMIPGDQGDSSPLNIFVHGRM